MVAGPCLCGDPACSSCGDPQAAALEEVCGWMGDVTEQDKYKEMNKAQSFHERSLIAQGWDAATFAVLSYLGQCPAITKQIEQCMAAEAERTKLQDLLDLLKVEVACGDEATLGRLWELLRNARPDYRDESVRRVPGQEDCGCGRRTGPDDGGAAGGEQV